MADFNFPSAPNTNDLYTLNGITYRYDGSRWRYANASVVTITGGNAVTTFNSLQSSNQDFAVGYSGSTLNISSSGNTHTFNIPLAGNATTGLVSGNAQTIYGVKTFNSDFIVSSSTGSTNATTGAFIVTGGVGIGGSLSVGSYIFLDNSYGSVTTTPFASIFAKAIGANATSLMQVKGNDGTVGMGMKAQTGTNSLIYSYGQIDFRVGSTIRDNDVPSGGTTYMSLSTTGVLALSSSTASTSTTAGALTVSGGAGIAKSLSIGGRLQLFNGANYTAFVSSASGNTVYTLPATSPATGTSVLQSDTSGVMSWVPMTATGAGGSGTVYDGSINSIPYYPAAGTAITGSSNFTNTGTSINVGYTAVATNSSSGALTVVGGVGIGGSLYVASATAISGVTINAGVITGNLTGTASTSTYSLQSGYGITAGTATTSANINIVSAASNTSHRVLFTPSSGSASGAAVSTESSFVYNPSTDILSVSGLAVTSGTASTSFSTGALVVTGGVGIGGSVYIQGDLTINGTTTTINSTTLTVDDKNIELGSVSVPSDVTAEAGGITLKGATDKIINWYAGSGWSSSESWNLAAGNTYKINNTTVISNSSIGTGITNSSLTALGTISTGTWAATAITAHYGGTGLQSPYVVGDLIYANTTTTWARVAAGTAGSILTSAGAGTTPYWSAPSAGGGGAGTVYSSLINTFAYYNITGTGVTGLSNFVNTGSGIALSFGTNSTSTTTGSISIRGGIGITGNAYIGGTTNITNTTSSTNSSSGALVVTGGVGVGGSVFIENRLVVSSSTASTNTTTGAVLIAGGVGISGQLTFTQASLGFTGIATNPSMSFIGATTSSPITLTVLTDNSLNWEGSQGSVFSIDSNLSTGEIFSVSDISGLPIISASAGQTVNINEFGGYTQIGNGSISASSTSTGSLVVAGGVGITSNAFIGGTTTITNTTNSTSTTSGALVVNGGLGITGNANIGGTVRITNTTQSINTSSGALTVSGGAGIAQSLFVGGNIVVSNNIYSGGNTFTKSGQAAGDIIFDNGVNDTAGLLYYYKNNTNFGLDVYAVGIGATRFRIVRDLNESGGSELWSIDRSGVVTRTGWGAGETINTRMYNYSDLNMAATATISATSYTTFATITYTPLSSSSYIWIEFSATYTVAGTSADDHWSNIEVNGSEIVNANQVWGNATGGGTRSGVLFPIAARYTNTGTAGIAISVRAKKGTSDDNNTIYGNTASGYMRIQEIGR